MTGGTEMFSIVLCTYNRAERLIQTLAFLDQLDPMEDAAIELIVVDNNSSDGTRSVCEGFAARARVSFRWVFENHQGLSHARNRGLAEADGSIIIFTDDDITVPSHWAAEYARVFREHEADCVFGRIVPDWGGDKPSWYDSKFGPIFGALDYGSEEFVVTTRNFEFFGANFGCQCTM